METRTAAREARARREEIQRMKRAWALLGAMACSAALAQPAGGTKVEFPVRTASGGEERIFGFLYLPSGASAAAKVPAMVVVHGSGGASDAREGDWARVLIGVGIAALATDSFTPRGIASTADDQSRLPTPQMTRDAFGALAFLASVPEIDENRVGVMGMSKGGSVTLDAADGHISRARSFAAYIPLYPGCATQWRNPQIKGPMLMLIGADDDYTGVKSCAEYVERIRAAGGNVQLKVYPGAHHGFDGDTRQFRPVALPRAQNARDCLVYVEDDLTGTTRAGTRVNLREPKELSATLQRECLRSGATFGSNIAAKREAQEDVRGFLKTHLIDAAPISRRQP
jgi:dienelactone hydrolase